MTVTIRTIGDPLPALDLPRLDGGRINLADLKGKRHLLFFWGSW
jgi:peroxiredoxin